MAEQSSLNPRTEGEIPQSLNYIMKTNIYKQTNLKIEEPTGNKACVVQIECSSSDICSKLKDHTHAQRERENEYMESHKKSTADHL